MQELANKLQQHFADWLENIELKFNECTVEVEPSHLRQFCLALRDQEDFQV